MNNTINAAKCLKAVFAIIVALSLTGWGTALSAYADDAESAPNTAAENATAGQDENSAAAAAGNDSATQPGTNAEDTGAGDQDAGASDSDTQTGSDSAAGTGDAANDGDQDQAAAAADAKDADKKDDDAAAAAAKAKKAPRTGDTPVCKIGSTEYNSIAEAVDAVADGVPTTITMIADATMDEQVDIAQGKIITLTDDGKAHRIDATAGMFNVSGDFTIAATSNDKLKLYGGDGGSDFGNIATVGKSGTGHLTLSAGTLYGGTVDNPSNGAVYMKDGTFDITGGIITDCTCSTYFNAPVYVAGSGVCNMSGGEISGNTSASCAGVLVVDFDKSKVPTFNLSGGKISNNTGTGGTAIYAMSNARINISGGEISENNGAESSASIVYLAGVSELTMTGGKITNNTSVYGGAVMTKSTGLCSFTAGEISGNVAGMAGGAIFGTQPGTQIYVENCLVEGNHATIMGGGLWCCPTGGADIRATHGIAIFGNTADGAGDDYASLYDDDDAKVKGNIHLSNYILGDNQVEYFTDGAVQPDFNKDPGSIWQGIAVAGVPRYDASNPGDPVTVDGPATENQAMKAIVGETGKANARNQATMIITNNTAAYGGGIATNGIVTAGFNDDDLDKEHEITVSKQDGAGASVEGATLTLANEIGDKIDEWTTDASGNRTLSLQPGTYTLTETKTPDGYKTADPITFTVDRTGAITIDGAVVGSVVMTDEKEEGPSSFQVQINKVNADGESLKGAELEVTGDGFTEAWTSDGTARTLSLQPGTYTFHEKAAPEGFLAVDDFTFKVSADGSIMLKDANEEQVKLADNTLTVTDQLDSPTNPKTSGDKTSGTLSKNAKTTKSSTKGTLSKTGDSTALLPLAVLALAGAAGCLVAWRRRKTN